jgi:uncharacterized lipoprotein YddW (UPF0748 family)
MTQKEFQKKSFLILLLTLFLLICMIGNAFLFPSSQGDGRSTGTVSASTATGSAITTTGVQAVWISFGDYKSAGLYNKSEHTFTANAKAYFKKLKKDGINTVYFHVVPCNDAIYPSKYLNWSSYMFKKSPSYDPLEILVKAAHSNGLSFHAWVNPYRKKMGTVYNPAKASSLRRIKRIVKEIIQNYDVDGIHFDDYFYPSRSRGAQFYKVSVAKRKKVINKMVRTIYKTVKNQDSRLLFGISPAGNIEYAQSLGCDLETWLSKKGYIDYIIPQIYWSDQYRLNGKTVPLFSQRLSQWVALNKNDTPMYIGLAMYRAGSRISSDLGWRRKNNNIVSQLKKSKNAGCEGFALFSSSYMYRSSSAKEMKYYRRYIKKNPFA